MAKSILQFTLLFLVLVLLQVLIFNHLYLFHTALPLVFIYFILRLPVTMSTVSVLTLSFLLGLTIDVFSNTAGMNALACTILGFIRLPMLQLYTPRDDDHNNNLEPSIKSLGATVFTKYALSASFIYCSLFFLIESFTFFNTVTLLLRIAGSTILTFIVIMCIDFLINQRSEKRL